jgi:hypothetical protein
MMKFGSLKCPIDHPSQPAHFEAFLIDLFGKQEIHSNYKVYTTLNLEFIIDYPSAVCVSHFITLFLRVDNNYIRFRQSLDISAVNLPANC